MYLFESLKTVAKEYLSPQQVQQIEIAYLYARDAHEGQTRFSGEPYITHPIAVAKILAEMHLDVETVIAALLHDVIEDTSVTQEALTEKFGDSISTLVAGVSKLDKLKFRNRKEAQTHNFRKMMIAMVQDIRVILIKLSDRLHNMRTLDVLRPDKRRRIARETLDVYAPIANRLGIHTIKNEFEELGFQALYPMRYRVLKEAIKKARGNRLELISSIRSEIVGRLTEASIDAVVTGREKNIYSIYRKMVTKERQFREIMDIYAFRIIVKRIDTCYRVLGETHLLYKPKPGRFKDYIAIPKTNGYQSLHTSLVGPHGAPVEIQIRTEFMDQMADRGIAAHWVYKQNENQPSTSAQIRAQQWMQNLLELQQSAGSANEFIESVKTDLYPDEIYVFTPEGRILELPIHATPVDFAYSVHTDIGHACVGARVDCVPYSLSRELESGQTVEIITAPGARPNAAWLNFVVTAKARTKIRQFLKKLRFSESVQLGRRLLNHALGNYNLEDISQERIDAVLADTRYESLEALLSSIGLGQSLSLIIARRLLRDSEELFQKQSGGKRDLPIRGVEGVLINFANCCRPIPNDPIVAHISPGRGLVIHLEGCKNIRGYEKDLQKYFSVNWESESIGELDYKTGIQVELVNHQGALAELANVIANSGSNIHGINADEKDGRVYQVNLLITAKNRKHLAQIMRQIRAIPDALRVSRSIAQ